jgi:hypothetical protein
MENETGRECSMHGRVEECIHDFKEKSEGRKPLGRGGRRWEENIKMDLLEMGWGVGWINLAQD